LFAIVFQTFCDCGHKLFPKPNKDRGEFILNEFQSQTFSKKPLAAKQLSMSVPVHVVQLHMKIGTADLAKHIKEIKVRAHVVLKLGYDLIRAGHAAYVEVKFFSHGDIYLALN